MPTITIDLNESLHNKTHPGESMFQHDAMQAVAHRLARIVGFIEALTPAQLEHVTHCRQLNALFVEGERGIGKTTFLLNIALYLKAYPDGAPYGYLLRSLHFIPPLDPTLLEHRKEVYEDFLAAIIAHLFNQLQDNWQSPADMEGAHPIFIAADRVADSLKGMRKGEERGLEKIVTYQSSLVLEENLHQLFKAVCQRLGVKAIVVMIDDTDMAMGRCFEVIDTIRRYFTSPYVIPIVTGQQELYRALLHSHFVCEFTANCPRKDEKLLDAANEQLVIDVRESYFDKVFPRDFRIPLKSFTTVCRTTEVMVRADRGNEIPIIFLNELQKRLLYPGIASRHYREAHDAVNENHTSRAALQHIHLHRDEIVSIARIYRDFLAAPERLLEHYINVCYDAMSNAKKTLIHEQFHEFRTTFGNVGKEGTHINRYNEFPHVYNGFAVWIMRNALELPDGRLGYTALLKHWAEHHCHQGYRRDAVPHISDDVACLEEARSPSIACFRCALDTLSKRESPQPAWRDDVLAITSFDFPLNLDVDADSDVDVFFHRLLLSDRETRSGEWSPLPTALRLVELLFLTLDEPGCSPQAIAEVVGLHDDRYPSEAERICYQFIDQGLVPALKAWHQTTKPRAHHISVMQMGLILESSREQLATYFPTRNFPFSNYTLGRFAADLCHILLDAVASSEKERNYLRHPPWPAAHIAESERYQVNIRQMVESDYLSLTKRLRNHPVMRALLDPAPKRTRHSQDTLPSPRLQTVVRPPWQFDASLDHLTSYAGEITHTNLDLQVLVAKLIDDLKQGRPNREQRDSIVVRLKRERPLRILRAVPRTQLDELVDLLGLPVEEFLRKTARPSGG